MFNSVTGSQDLYTPVLEEICSHGDPVVVLFSLSYCNHLVKYSVMYREEGRMQVQQVNIQANSSKQSV